MNGKKFIQEGGLYTNKICWTFDTPMASLSTCHLGDLGFALDGILVKYST